MDHILPPDYFESVIAGEPKIPFFMEILPVNPCNHQCVFCISADYRDNRDRLSWPVMCKLIGEIGAAGNGFIRICGGGEPLLYPHAEEMLQLCKWSGVTTHLTTNGSLLKGSILQAAMEACSLIRVSVNGGNAASFAATHRVVEKEFARVTDNLRAVREHPLRSSVRLELSFVICSENEASISDFLLLAAGLEADLAVLITNTEGEIVEVDRQIRLAEVAMEKFDPPAGMEVRLRRSQSDAFFETDLPSLESLLFGVVAANGDIYTSCHHVGMPEFKLGNLEDGGSLLQIYGSSEVQDHRMAYAFGTAKKLEKFVLSARNHEFMKSYVSGLAVEQ
jgi:MoaA/NifB/PqqE/SkfB family radical SAM enzyme